MFKTVEDALKRASKIKDCKTTDGNFDLNKRYKFSYDRLLQDDRLCYAAGVNTWINRIKAIDGQEVSIVDKENAVFNGWNIARTWCIEIEERK